jgi:hypothetical protein
MYFVQKKNLQEEDSQYQEDRKLDLIHYQMVIFQSLNLLNVTVTDSVIKMIYLCIHPMNINCVSDVILQGEIILLKSYRSRSEPCTTPL